jgi:hypothetical protein
MRTEEPEARQGHGAWVFNTRSPVEAALRAASRSCKRDDFALVKNILV